MTWVRQWPARSTRARRFVCFPPAGAGAGFYRDWAPALPADCELWSVQYPGREDRFGEPLIADLQTMADQIAAVPGLLDGTPLWLFGHSMGALLAYEVARRIEPAAPLQRLVVSGRIARRHQKPGTLYQLDDDAFSAQVLKLGGVPEVLLADPEMRAVLLPIMRSDYQAVETYSAQPHPPLQTPVLALAGTDDQHAPPPAMEHWSDITTGPFRLAAHPGGHFFLVPELQNVLRDVLAPL
ncbi:thioesterase II family protein [Kineosporia babensis]|uniref:Alpha/beta fold hydrolase n=1 Tax=Kineosporia babensis TaxID=499548 RepID=A0A9X1NFA9_9ACTN|nr:alpha/beta fold hydrolase [Kineosporia babensis]